MSDNINQQPTKSQPVPTQSNTIGVNLEHDVTVNGTTYPKGTNVQVPKGQAEDITRISHDHQKQLDALHVKRESLVNAGSIAAGSGAE